MHRVVGLRPDLVHRFIFSFVRSSRQSLVTSRAPTLIWNNLKYSLRYLRQNKIFSVINIVGLAIGITSALFIYIYVSYERSFDRFHSNYETIYRVIGVDENMGVTSNNVGITMPPIGPAMVAELPEVEAAVRLNTQGQALVGVGNRQYYTEFLVYSEDPLFEVFDFPLLQGQRGNVINEPNTAVITEDFADKIFGDENPLGKIFRLDNARDIEVTGVMENNRPDSTSTI